eukprot:5712190-Amphidinium_carterae.1
MMGMSCRRTTLRITDDAKAARDPIPKSHAVASEELCSKELNSQKCIVSEVALAACRNMGRGTRGSGSTAMGLLYFGVLL